MFSPRSLAIVGASDNPRKWGHWLARGALRGADRREVHLVNRRGAQILGHPSFPSLGDLPGSPELVVIALPDDALESAVDEALGAGAKAIIAISAADNEDGATGDRDRKLADRVRAAGAVLLGPNCLGVIDTAERLELSSNPLPAGSIGLISQSGNLALELGMLAAEAELGFSRFASLGNQADLDATALVRELIGHDATRLIALYVEDFRDGREFARATEQAVVAGKPVVLLAVERGPATTRAVRSHTGALASDGAAIDAACRAAGVQRVDTPGELIDAAQALLRARRSAGRRVAVLSDGGGHGSVAAARCTATGLEVPELGSDTAAGLRALLGSRAAVANPVDLAGAAEQDVHAFDRTAALLHGSDEVDAILLTGYFGGYGLYSEESGQEEVRAAGLLGELASSTGRPVVAHTMYASSAAADALRAADVPVYPTVERAVCAVATLVTAGGQRPDGVPRLPASAPQAVIAGDSYEQARGLLRAGGVPFAAQLTVSDLDGALAAARTIGYPVALKALGMLHKSDAGGVVLGLADPAALEHAYQQLEQLAGRGACSVEAMAPLEQGFELLIGARWDARFGPVVVAGAGGIYTEILRDTAVALAPIDERRALSMLRSLGSAPLLTGARGRPQLDLEAAARALAALSRVAAAHPEISEIEINPLLVTGEGAVGLDARLVGARNR
jgi:acyl-CoA synthetase (NDP forming)